MATASQGSSTTASASNANPGEPSASAILMRARTKILRACYGGTDTMRIMDREFLPQYEKESNARYQTRLDSTFALNKLREAVDAASAKPFRTLMKVDSGGDPEVDIWAQDIDLQGNHLHVFAHQFFNNAMLDGMAHILVDHPSTINLPNLAAQQAANVRPFFKLVKEDQRIASYDEYVGGDRQVVHVRVMGSRTERTPDFKEIVWNQIYVIEKPPGQAQGVVQLYEQKAGSGGSQWTLMSEQPITLAEVPFVTLYAGDKESDYVVRPVFMDLAYKQIEHWISSSDQRSILAAARFPMLAVSGVQIDPEDEAQFAIGPFKVLYAPEPQGRWYYVEPKGTAIESGRLDLEALEMHMDMMALNPVTGTHRQYVPQNERDIQETRVHSVVHDMALGCKDAIERSLMFAGAWTSKDLSQVTVSMNTEFGNTKDKMAELGLLLKAWEKRGVSRETFLREARNRNLLSENFDLVAELALLDQLDGLNAENPNAGGGQPGVQPNPEDAGPGKKKPAAAAKEVPGWPAGQNRPTAEV